MITKIKRSEVYRLIEKWSDELARVNLSTRASADLLYVISLLLLSQKVGFGDVFVEFDEKEK